MSSLKEEKAFLEADGLGMDHLCLFSDDANAACNWLKDQGVMIEIEPLGYNVLRKFYVRDPSGQVIQLIEMLDP